MAAGGEKELTTKAEKSEHQNPSVIDLSQGLDGPDSPTNRL